MTCLEVFTVRYPYCFDASGERGLSRCDSLQKRGVAKVIADNDIAGMNDLPESLQRQAKGEVHWHSPIIETQAETLGLYSTNGFGLLMDKYFRAWPFNSGVRSINVEFRIQSRGSAQISPWKSSGHQTWLLLRELEAFAKFGSDLDAATLNASEKDDETLKSQTSPNDPYTVEDVAIIYAGSKLVEKCSSGKGQRIWNSL